MLQIDVCPLGNSSSSAVAHVRPQLSVTASKSVLLFSSPNPFNCCFGVPVARVASAEVLSSSCKSQKTEVPIATIIVNIYTECRRQTEIRQIYDYTEAAGGVLLPGQSLRLREEEEGK